MEGSAVNRELLDRDLKARSSTKDLRNKDRKFTVMESFIHITALDSVDVVVRTIEFIGREFGGIDDQIAIDPENQVTSDPASHSSREFGAEIGTNARDREGG